LTEWARILELLAEQKVGKAGSTEAEYSVEVQSELSYPESRDVVIQEESTACASSSAETILMSTADESSRFLSWAEASNVGDLTIDQIHAEIRRIARNYLKVLTMPLFERTRALRDRVLTLISGHRKLSRSRELYSAAGWSMTVLAWISTDLGHPDFADEHFTDSVVMR
ncbi:MAG: hypothetical protein ACRD4I_13945, partial [Candidatus Angelobacter sp.]